MTVAELIERLQAFELSMRVVTPGFDESGYDDIETVEAVDVVFHDDWEVGHRGRHRDPERAQGGTPVRAVLLNF